MTDDDFKRLENKVDKLTDAVSKLILFEERQATQGERIGSVEVKIGVHDATLLRVDRKIDQWVNRGVGVWAAAAVVFSLVQFWKK